MKPAIIICETCCGTGKQEQSELTHYHFREYDYWDDPCRVCGGTGRMVVESNLRKLSAEELKLRNRPPKS